MWAQVISTCLKPGKEQELPRLLEALHSTEQPDSGLLRSMTFRDENDPSRVYTLVVFESEERARIREQDPRRHEGLANVRAIMADVFDGPPQFRNLAVIDDFAP